MKSTTTFRSFNGTVYVRIPPGYEEYLNLKEQIIKKKSVGEEPTCTITDINNNEILITFLEEK